LLDGEYTISVMEAYQKGTLTFASEDMKNDFLRKFEMLATDRSTHDLAVLKREQLKDILSSKRQYLDECSDFVSKKSQASSLEIIGRVLIEQNQADDALTVLQRCVGIDPDYAACWAELGDASVSLGRTSEAKRFYKKAIDVGAFDEMNAAAIKSAKFSLFKLEHPGGDPMCAPGMPGLSLHLDQCRDYFDAAPKEDATASLSRSFGTGFSVSNQGYILTNNHVVAGCKTLTTGDGKPVQVVSKNVKADLALLKADYTPSSVAVFRSGAAPRLGDAVVVFGFPLRGILSSEGNVSTGILSATSGLQNDVRFVQISAPVQPGNSGGPLFDSSGHVLGVVVGKLDALEVARTTGDVPQNVNFAVHWSEVRSFLDEEGVQYRKEPSLRGVSTRDIATLASKISVAIQCARPAP
jgi:S1-C subfamily serine protease